MPHGRLVSLALDLESQGIRGASLRQLQEELDAIENPSMLGRLSASARESARLHWNNIVGELQESRELLAIITRRVSGAGPLSDDDADKVRSQLGDMLRVVPAGILALANAALPLPGTGLLTPWLLSRLGLMPSRWREAHLLAELHAEEDRLRAAGHAAAADRLHDLAEDLEEEADAREALARDAALLPLWDENDNGRWDEAERAAYDQAVAALRALDAREFSRRQWFLRIDDHLFGPCRLSELPVLPARALVSLRGRSGWVAIDALPDAARPAAAARPEGTP